MTKSLYATLRALPGKQDKLAELFAKLVEQVHKEPGNVRYEVYTLVDDPLTFHVEETYKDEAGLIAHKDSEHYNNFKKSLGGIIDPSGGVKVVFLNPIKL